VLSRDLLRWPFSPAWWAFTFPLDALAYAAARHSIDHPGALWQVIAAATLLIAVAFVVLALVKSALALRPPAGITGRAG
jgi:tellurite resistance protein